MGEQRIHQRIPPVASRRMHHHPGRFVDDNDICILIGDAERQAQRQRFGLLWRRHGKRESLALFDPVRGVVYRPPGQRDLLSGQQRLNARAAQAGDAAA